MKEAFCRLNSWQRIRKIDVVNNSNYKEIIKKRFGVKISIITKCKHFTSNEVSIRRLGFITSHQSGNAVIRNRTKRIFRELFRRNQQDLPAICEVLVVLSKKIKTISFVEFKLFFLSAVLQATNRI